MALAQDRLLAGIEAGGKDWVRLAWILERRWSLAWGRKLVTVHKLDESPMPLLTKEAKLAKLRGLWGATTTPQLQPGPSEVVDVTSIENAG